MKISCVMTTYGRFTCVERSIQFFLNQQTDAETELLIFNTDVDYPLQLGSELEQYTNIRVINNNTDYITQQPYNNVGAIRRDATVHVDGKYYICWDDDDIFMPWNIQQCLDGITKYSDYWAWKPFRSMFWKTGHKPELAGNVMEASIISLLDKIKMLGFDDHQGGGEHLKWVNHLNKNKLIFEDKNSIPAYCFNWSDQGIMRGHKQSGTYGKLDNFEYHKLHTTDHALRPLSIFPSKIIDEIYAAHIETIKNNIGIDVGHNYSIAQELVDKYIV